MCGIIGLLSKNIDKEKFNNSLDLLSHRGPDAKNTFFDNSIALGHTRLSIQDLSNNGNQPMLDKENGNLIIFNGEIYNYKSLRKDLEKQGERFFSHSDTEVILKLYRKIGLEKSLKIIEGMYSFAIYDKQKNKLFLCKDRFGMKPLFYNENNNEFIFSSEIKPIINYCKKIELDKKKIVIPMLMGIHNNSSTYFQNIKEVGPGEFLVFDINTHKINKETHSHCSDLIDENYYNQLDGFSHNKLLEHYDEVFREVVGMHLVSDAPTSILYSGGLDSTLVTKYALEFDKNIECFFFNSFYSKTLSIVEKIKEHESIKLNIFNEKKFDLFYEIPEMVYRNECILNSSGAALMLVAKEAQKKGIKSMLTGDAADELFGGYSTHVKFYNRNFMQKNKISKFVFKVLNSILPGIENYGDDTNNDYFSDLVNKKDSMLLPLQILTESNSKLSSWERNREKYSFIKNDFERSMQSYLLNFLDNFVHRYLIRSDRSGMSRSLEFRIPFLGTKIAKLALNTPLKKKINYDIFSQYPGLTSLSLLKQKIILRDLAKFTGGINKKIINRKKEGITMNIRLAKHILKKSGANTFKEFFKITDKNLNFFLDQRDNELFLWGFFQTDIFLRLFYKHEKHEDIKEEFKRHLNSYSIN